jgi:hypothetical protein
MGGDGLVAFKLLALTWIRLLRLLGRASGPRRWTGCWRAQIDEAGQNALELLLRRWARGDKATLLLQAARLQARRAGARREDASYGRQLLWRPGELLTCPPLVQLAVGVGC